MSKIAFDHELARQAAGRLDSLADQLESGMTGAGGSLNPAAAALDAVSATTGDTLDSVGSSFRDSYLTGVTELRKIAANMRAHSDSFGDTDTDAVDSFRGLL
ncbi:PE domain-containing protein [Nocardia sp. alder85J]|uniref:PE domain-containing protein n=1 Tax=Nocardia sp. alder85J TaxID=2862949 RepID=UPI001CD390EC|nr:PE domain-containing protein [Nocardia sp. alder85J]MCX4093080.1 PE domain-containing protein [Nocardia sp. alder85J]